MNPNTNNGTAYGPFLTPMMEDMMVWIILTRDGVAGDPGHETRWGPFDSLAQAMEWAGIPSDIPCPETTWAQCNDPSSKLHGKWVQFKVLFRP